MYEDFEQEYYEEPDYEAFERRQLDLDRDAGEFDMEFDLGEIVEFDEFESDLWDESND